MHNDDKLMTTEPALAADKIEIRRTIPQLRKLINDQLDSLIAAYGGSKEVANIRAYLEETKRRSPKYKVARRKDVDPSPEIIIAIREYKEQYPDASYKNIALKFGNTSVRCVSFALVGRRDGRAVYDKDGRKIRRELKAAPAPLPPANYSGGDCDQPNMA